MNALSIILVILLSVAVSTISRRYVLLPFILTACLVPMNQRIEIAGLDFTALRIILLFGILRLMLRGEMRPVAWNGFDKLLLTWNIVGTIVYTLQLWDMQAVIRKSGVMYDCLGMYWIFRQTITTWDDMLFVIKLFAICAIISTPLIALEKFQQHSVYSIFGQIGPSFHRGRYRCMGPFSHYIMMGTFWVSLLPLFYAAYKTGTQKMLYLTAMLGAFACVVFSASSTPLITLMAMALFWMLFNQRRHGKKMLVATCLLLTTLHMVMKAPVWHLIARIDIFSGSTGWHRYHLIDEFIKNASSWFLLGTSSTDHWGYGLGDVTNQYVLEAVRGGFITLCIFGILVYSAIQMAGSASVVLKKHEHVWLCWGACIAMIGHAINFLGTSYFGQTLVLLYLNFAICSFLHNRAKAIIDERKTSEKILERQNPSRTYLVNG